MQEFRIIQFYLIGLLLNIFFEKHLNILKTYINNEIY